MPLLFQAIEEFIKDFVEANREALPRIGRFAMMVVGISLAFAVILGGIHSTVTGARFVESFSLAVFGIFLLLLMTGVLSGPGMFLSRPKFAPLDQVGASRWRQWLSVPPSIKDKEFFELVIYTGLAFLLLAIGTVIAAVLGP